MEKVLKQLSTFQRVNNASDDAASLAISQKLQAQINGYNKGAENAAVGQNLLYTAGGGVESIESDLQRIRELAVGASNGTLTSNDKAAIQVEIDQLVQNIDDTVANTTFNEQALLDGTFTGKTVGTNSDGNGLTINLPDLSSEALGIQDFDVTGEFSIDDIDNALSTIDAANANIGTITNSLDRIQSVNETASLNLASANSQMIDLELPLAITAMNTQQILQQYNMFAQKQEEKEDKNQFDLLT
jgi:flagellin